MGYVPTVDSYLAELDASLRGSRREKRDLLTEARDHLADDMQARVDAGATQPDAEVAAVRDFGTVHEIAPSYQAVLSAGQCRRLSGWLLVLVVAQPLLWGMWDALPYAPAADGPQSGAYQLADSYAESFGAVTMGLAMVTLVGGHLAFRHFGIREWMLRAVFTVGLVSTTLLGLVSVTMLTTSGDVQLVSIGFAAAASWVPMGVFAAACVRAMRAIEPPDAPVRATQS